MTNSNTTRQTANSGFPGKPRKGTFEWPAPEIAARLMPCLVRLAILGLLAAHAASVGAETSANALTVAFLSHERSEQDMGPHEAGALATTMALCDDVVLLVADDAGFVDAGNKPRELDAFDVVWYHQGDAIARNTLYSGPHLAALRRFAENGGGLLLSGGALAIVDYLGLEQDVRAQRHDLENYRDPAAMVPVEAAHPVFADMATEDGLIWLSGGGCRAVADFYWGGPAAGMVLGNTPAGVQRPLVEYELGAGRLIVFGWRWPDYADMQNPYRENLLQLTRNMLGYLADARQWRPVRIRTEFPGACPDEPGIAQARWTGMRMAIEDLCRTFPDQYRDGRRFLERLDALETAYDQLPDKTDEEALARFVQPFEALQREALLANPLLDFDRLLMIRRRADRLGLPMNYHGNDDLVPTGYENTLTALSPVAPDGRLETVFTPDGDRFIGDIDLHYDAEKLLLSMPDEQGRWGVVELDLTKGALSPLALIDDPDVHNYDACYLPDERIVFTSTAPFVGVPCLGGRSKVANLYLRDHDGRIRRLTNDQDHNWSPRVLNNGRILYQRWEYADIAHAFTRLLFHANPDGAAQMEFYGSNSFWPTAMFYARPIPGHPTKVATIVGGHHDAPRQGELVILDPARGRHEVAGVVQRIPGRGKPVEPVILDGLISASWPRFLHPWPLNEHYFIVACKPDSDALWGVYLVDVFDNFVLLHEEPGWAFLEPVPWRKTQRQPVLPDRTDPDATEATVMLVDVYHGPGLAGVPRGAVKSLRLVGYNYTFHGLGAEPDRVGLDGPWDVKRILGTVPVEPDGSAWFRVPACTPVSVQPLDDEGKALALMRSWMTAMPGEALACVGCHEPQNTTAPLDRMPLAFRREPSPITAWHGPARGFSFAREVQPVLNVYCIGCHHGEPLADGQATFDLTDRPVERIPSAFQMHFSPSYMELRRWVHTPTLESDARLLPPRDFHADASRLVQLLRDDHYGINLCEEAWDRLITWIDLNAPFHGAWQETVAADPGKLAAARHGAQRRRELHRRHAGIDEEPDAIHPAATLTAPAPTPTKDAFQALCFSEAPPAGFTECPDDLPIIAVAIAEDVTLELVYIEAGSFIMGTNTGYPNERPQRAQTIDAPFLMGRFEITNQQYRCFDPDHDSGLVTGEAYQFGHDERGFTLNRPEQPVVRVSWDQAMAFCAWLSDTTGRRFTLPTEAQWEYACRAGTATPFWYGGLDCDFSPYANFSDKTHHTVHYPHVPNIHPPWRPADTRFDDRWRVAAPVGAFTPNPWGLHDMHGNVAEWTSSVYHPHTGKDAHQAREPRRVVRGGSWLDLPKRGRSAFRLHYNSSQAVFDVGFRVVCEP